MDYRPIERAPGAFQQTVTAEQIQAMCRRAFGRTARVTAAVELGAGMYNNTYRVDLDTAGPVILRVAPEPARQSRVERELMRNEHASLPYLAPIAPLLARTLAVDFTHDLIGRDHLFQTVLDGIPAPEGLAAYPRPRWGSFFRQMGEIARTIHSVRGTRFGRVAGPGHSTWSEAVIASLDDAAADLADAGLDPSDVETLADAAAAQRDVLDEITEPRLLHGDLWTVNVMIARDAPEPTITGVFDCDRMSWGDPDSDWPIMMAARRPGTERDAFWESYGARPDTPAAARRALFYRARHVVELLLEQHRLGRYEQIPATYDDLRGVLRDVLDRGEV